MFSGTVLHDLAECVLGIATGVRGWRRSKLLLKCCFCTEVDRDSAGDFDDAAGVEDCDDDGDPLSGMRCADLP